ncbi:hypothetical protein [Stenotrophomonas phage BUCT555]|nr:hypothetical protein [Stenotrophomonas phage BUCT555]
MATILTIGYHHFEVTADVAAGMIKLLESGGMRPVEQTGWESGEWKPTDGPKVELKMNQKLWAPPPPEPAQLPPSIEHVIDAEVAP